MRGIGETEYTVHTKSSAVPRWEREAENCWKYRYDFCSGLPCCQEGEQGLVCSESHRTRALMQSQASIERWLNVRAYTYLSISHV